MEKKIFKRNIRNMRIVLRFLKETRLLPLWQEYFYQQVKAKKRFCNKHWSNEREPDQVLGNTSFTRFIADELGKRDGVEYDIGIPIYIRFAYWLQQLKLKGYRINQDTMEHINKKTYGKMSDNIVIDPITKKTKLMFHKRCL